MATAQIEGRIQRVKQGVREIAYMTGVSSGCTGFLNATDRLNRTGLYAFIGHHVVPVGEDAHILSADRLYDRLVHLRKHFDMVSAAEALAWLRDPEPGERLATITFDDGYRDNLTVGLKVLEAASAPATCFVATEPVLTGKPFWFDLVRSAVAEGPNAAMSVPWVRAIAEQGGRHLADALVHELNQLPPAARDARVAEFADTLDYDIGSMPPHLQPLSPGELADLASSPLITIGAHTHTHSTVSCCSEEQLRDELTQNVTALEQLTGRRPHLFAYPKGATETSSFEIASLLEEVQLQAAFTTQRQINRMKSDPWLLGRFPLGAGPVSQFAWELMQLSF